MLLRAICVLDSAASALLAVVARDIHARQWLRAAWVKAIMACAGINVGLGIGALVVHDEVSGQLTLFAAVGLLIALHLGSRSTPPRAP